MSCQKVVVKLGIILLLLVILSGQVVLASDEEAFPGLQSFLAGVFEQQTGSDDIPGAVVSVVNRDSLLYADGFGYADREENERFRPDHLIRAGSAGKLFTWLAVLQQVEAGRLDLEEDINNYLPSDLQFDYNEESPIQLKDLMTHTSGFEDRQIGILVRDAENLVDLADYLQANRPEIVYEPGTTPAYSNYGTTLAAYLVELVSGEDYHSYLEKNIFTPLRMRSSTSRQELGSEMRGELSVGYNKEGNFLQPQEPEVFQEYPAGGHTVSANDMANLMQALLNGGELLGWRILGEEYVDLLFENAFSYSDDVSGWSYGLMEYRLTEEKIYWHGGDTRQFHTAIFFLPEKDLAFFAAYNGPGGTFERFNLLEALDRQYFGGSPTWVSQSQDAEVELEQYGGEYLASRRNHSSPEKLFARLSSVNIIPNAEYLEVESYKTEKYYPQDEDNFVRQDGRESLKFIRDEAGEIEEFVFTNNPTAVFEKLFWMESSRFHLLLVIFSLIVFVVTPLANIISFFKKSNLKGFASHGKIPAGPGIILSLLGIGYVIYQVRTLFYLSENPYAWSDLTGLLSLVPILMIILLVWMVYQLIKYGPLAKSFLSQIIVLVAGSVFLFVLYYYNFIGFMVF
ncbi:MAG: serine hydrolase [Bacillota bacterium]